MVQLPAALEVSGHYLLTGVHPREPPGAETTEPYDQARAEVAEYLRQRVLAAVAAALADPTPPTAGEAEREFARWAGVLEDLASRLRRAG